MAQCFTGGGKSAKTYGLPDVTTSEGVISFPFGVAWKDIISLWVFVDWFGTAFFAVKRNGKLFRAIGTGMDYYTIADDATSVDVYLTAGLSITDLQIVV